MISSLKNFRKSKLAIITGTISIGLFALTFSNTLFHTQKITEPDINTNAPKLVFIDDHNYYKQYQQFADIMKDSLDERKETIYQFVVNNTSTYYLKSPEDIEHILQQIMDTTVGDQFETVVTLTQDDASLTSNIAFDEIQIEETPVLRRQAHDIALSTASDSMASQTVSQIRDSITSNETSDIVYLLTKPEDKVNSLDFMESITIEPILLDHQELSDVDMIVSDLLKTNVTPDTYYVEPGDSPYSIALDYGMTLDEVYDLNEGLEEKAKSLQVGDPVIIEKLVPELSVIITTEESRFAPVSYDTIYREDDSIYIGLEIVSEKGIDGTSVITEEIQTSNNETLSRQLLSEDILLEPIPELILVGTKPIPDKGPVGYIIKPVNYSRITANFGSYGSYWSNAHTGTDFKVPTGTSVKAADGGIVTFSGWKGAYGYMIDIDHGNGVVTRYAHNSKLLVSVGDEVGQGELISKSGNTGNSSGPHLHFELIFDGTAVNVMDWFNIAYNEE